jgi:hypothetical protein
MKTISLLALMVLTLICGCNQPKSNLPEGTWQVVSFQYFSSNTLVWELGKEYNGSEMKIWSKSHFVFVGRYQQDTTFTDNYGGGTYQLDGNHYEEKILYYPDQKVVGTTIRLLLEIKSDTLIQTWPADENWQIDQNNYYIQKLTRLE